ncbi:hypothetical protein OCI51_26705 (plasmid) [Lysinibacillus capsici]|uniref:hypothetical protein n=1 Tax=Lysinibacillus capsici TaxID=2115968 RepID=UPI0021DA3435|nr:hypothetical protein [Lysinibacillus capsici]UYB50195.1 hypothetical protein OCI51_27080 [Lysinibacillus capsici]UYB50273.1 hypothetical protein OCI51_26705 [Lysinibacillus capsici]
MRFFEVMKPYYALLKAKNPSNAKDMYTDKFKEVTPITVDEILEMKEVPVEYASIAFSRSLHDREIPLEAIVQKLTNRSEAILTIDGCLL